jgi:hypothetical protein
MRAEVKCWTASAARSATDWASPGSGQQTSNGGRESPRVLGLSEHSRALPQHLREAPGGRGCNRNAKRHGVQDRRPQPFLARAHDEQVRVGHQPGGLGDVAEQVDPILERELPAKPLQRRSLWTLASDDPVKGGEAVGEARGRPEQRRVVLVPHQRRDVRRDGGAGAQTEPLADPQAGRAAQIVQRDARVDDHDPLAADAVRGEDVSDRPRDGNDALGPDPEPRPAEVEIHPPSGDQRPPGEPGRQAAQGDRVGIVRVHDCPRPAQLGQQARQHPRIQPRTPGDGVHPHAVGGQPLGELASGAGHHDLRHTRPRQLAGQEPDLPLPAAPLTSGRDVDDVPRHASLATAARRFRSSARLKGLCRYGRSRLSRNARVSPRTVSPVLNTRRDARPGCRRASSS